MRKLFSLITVSVN